MTKRLLALLMALTMCLSLAACKGDDNTKHGGIDGENPSESQSAAPSADPSASESPAIEVDLTQTMYGFASGMDDGSTALTVNGVSIPNELFFYWLSYDCYYMYTYYSQYGMGVDFNEETTYDYLINDVQTAVTYYACLRQLCEENGITVTEEQMAEYTAQMEALVNDSYGGDKELMLKSYGLSEDAFEYINTNGYLFTNLADKLVGQPSDADLEQYVEDNGIFSVKHILLMTATEQEDGSLTLLNGSAPTNEDGSEYTGTAEEYNAAQKALAESLLARLQDPSAPDTLFDELMTTYSEDGGVSTNPDGYTFTAEDSLVGGFREAALELEPGELSGIVETDYGYHIMLRLPVDASTYESEWLSVKTDALITAALETAEVSLAPELAEIDINSFYERYLAYGLEFYNQMNSVEEE